MFELGVSAGVDDHRAARLIDDMHDRLNRPEHLLDVMVDEMHDYERDGFSSNGHGEWPALAEGTLRQKSAGRMMVDSGDLLAALTTSRDLMSDEAAVSADVAYAGYLKRGTGRMPSRDPAPEPDESVTRAWAQTMLDLIVEGHR